MTSRRIEIEEEQGAAEEGSGGSIPLDPELAAALREASGESDPPPAPAADPDLARKLQETEQRLVRLYADHENYKRRALKERTDASQYGHQNLVKDLLPTVDNLERAIEHARKSGSTGLEALLQGVELVHRELLASLVKHGVVRIETVGCPFDPNLHEALAQVPNDRVAPNTILEEMQAGYRLRDRLLRPARVVLATAAPGAAPAGTEPGSDAEAGEDAGSAPEATGESPEE